MDAQTALNYISTEKNAGRVLNVEALRNLAASVDVSTTTNTVVLYSGGVDEIVDQQPDIQEIKRG